MTTLLERMYRVGVLVGHGYCALWSEDPVVYASSLPLVVGGVFVELSNDSSGEKSQVATTREPRLSASNRVSRDANAGGSDESDRVSRRRDRQVEQAIGVAREQGNNSLTPTIRSTQGSSVCFRCFCCPSCTQVFRLLVRVSCLCRLSSRIADIFQSYRDAPIQCAQPASAVWSPVKGFALHLGGYGLHAPVRDQESFMEKNRTDNVENAALTSLASNGTVVSLQVCRGRGAHFVHRFSACVCLFPASVGCLHELHAGFLFHNDTADICQCEMPRHRDRPMRKPVNTKGVMAEKRSHVRSREDRTTDCLDRGPSQRRHVVPVRVWCRHGAPAVDVADKTSRCQVPHSQFRGHLFDKQYRARTPAQGG